MKKTTLTILFTTIIFNNFFSQNGDRRADMMYTTKTGLYSNNKSSTDTDQTDIALGILGTILKISDNANKPISCEGNCKNGKGKGKFRNGIIWDGNWKNGVPNGYGYNYRGNLLIYEGNVKNGSKHGIGTQYNVKNGKIVYNGEWVNGYAYGKGKRYRVGGGYTEAYWNSEKVVSKEILEFTDNYGQIPSYRGGFNSYTMKFHGLGLGMHINKKDTTSFGKIKCYGFSSNGKFIIGRSYSYEYYKGLLQTTECDVRYNHKNDKFIDGIQRCYYKDKDDNSIYYREIKNGKYTRSWMPKKQYDKYKEFYSKQKNVIRGIPEKIKEKQEKYMAKGFKRTFRVYGYNTDFFKTNNQDPVEEYFKNLENKN